MSEINRGIFRYFLQTVMFFPFFALCLFAFAGRAEWIMGWLRLGLNAAGKIISAMILWAYNSKLMGERASIRRRRNLDRVPAGCLALWVRPRSASSAD